MIGGMQIIEIIFNSLKILSNMNDPMKPYNDSQVPMTSSSSTTTTDTSTQITTIVNLPPIVKHITKTELSSSAAAAPRTGPTIFQQILQQQQKQQNMTNDFRMSAPSASTTQPTQTAVTVDSSTQEEDVFDAEALNWVLGNDVWLFNSANKSNQEDDSSQDPKRERLTSNGLGKKWIDLHNPIAGLYEKNYADVLHKLSLL